MYDKRFFSFLTYYCRQKGKILPEQAFFVQLEIETTFLISDVLDRLRKND